MIVDVPEEDVGGLAMVIGGVVLGLEPRAGKASSKVIVYVGILVGLVVVGLLYMVASLPWRAAA